ncbi:MAG: hypothetical protein WC477_02110 [Patescibacteria group bacterium]
MFRFDWFQRLFPSATSASPAPLTSQQKQTISHASQETIANLNRSGWIDRMILQIPVFLQEHAHRPLLNCFCFYYSPKEQEVTLRVSITDSCINFNRKDDLGRLHETDWNACWPIIIDRLRASFSNRVLIVSDPGQRAPDILPELRPYVIAWHLRSNGMSNIPLR